MTAPLRQSAADRFNWLLDRLTQGALAEIRPSWRDYLFHFTDIENVVRILDRGALLSRSELIRNNVRWKNAASSQVIDDTDSYIKEYVRLYFRPKTPTAYRIEGIRPKHCYYDEDAHCPVPVYLVFNLRDIITLLGVKFSDGNLARNRKNVFQSPKDFGQLPFGDIYSDGVISSDRRDEIKNRRHAEVIVPNSLNLQYLKYIVCRSQAEFDTLRNLLQDKWPKWKDRTLKASRPQHLFDMNWLYISSCGLSRESAVLELNEPADPRDYGPFELETTFEDLRTGQAITWKKTIDNVCTDPTTKNLHFKSDVPLLDSSHYTFRVAVDGNLAYLGKYEPEIPF